MYHCTNILGKQARDRLPPRDFGSRLLNCPSLQLVIPEVTVNGGINRPDSARLMDARNRSSTDSC